MHDITISKSSPGGVLIHLPFDKQLKLPGEDIIWHQSQFPHDYTWSCTHTMIYKNTILSDLWMQGLPGILFADGWFSLSYKTSTTNPMTNHGCKYSDTNFLIPYFCLFVSVRSYWGNISKRALDDSLNQATSNHSEYHGHASPWLLPSQICCATWNRHSLQLDTLYFESTICCR